MKIIDSTMAMLQKSMDLQFKRYTVLTGNIANSETPQYRARDIDFAGQLSTFLSEKKDTVIKTHPRHLDIRGSTRDHIIYDNSGAMGADGNNVDLDLQIGKISVAARAYSSAANLLSTKFRMLRAAITGRGGA